MASGLKLRGQECLLFPMVLLLLHVPLPATCRAGWLIAGSQQVREGRTGYGALPHAWHSAGAFPEVPPEQLLERVLLVLIQVRKPRPREVE